MSLPSNLEFDFITPPEIVPKTLPASRPHSPNNFWPSMSLARTPLRPKPPSPPPAAKLSRPHLYQRVLDRQTARRQPPARNFLPRLFQAAVPALFHRATDRAGRLVHDPFMGRGTTLDRSRAAGPCALRLRCQSVEPGFGRPRLRPPTLEQIHARLAEIDFKAPTSCRKISWFFTIPKLCAKLPP